MSRRKRKRRRRKSEPENSQVFAALGDDDIVDDDIIEAAARSGYYSSGERTRRPIDREETTSNQYTDGYDLDDYGRPYTQEQREGVRMGFHMPQKETGKSTPVCDPSSLVPRDVRASEAPKKEESVVLSKPKKLPDRRPTCPTLEFGMMAWLKLQYMLERGSTEVGGWGVALDPNNLFRVDEFIMVPQICRTYQVDFTDEGLVDYNFDMMDRELHPNQTRRIWIHTHPEIGAEPSSQDWSTFLNKMLGESDWGVMFILSRDQMTSAYLGLRTTAGIQTKKLKVVWTLDDINDDNTDLVLPRSAWHEEYQRCVTIYQPPKPTASSIVLTKAERPAWSDIGGDQLHEQRAPYLHELGRPYSEHSSSWQKAPDGDGYVRRDGSGLLIPGSAVQEPILNGLTAREWLEIEEDTGLRLAGTEKEKEVIRLLFQEGLLDEADKALNELWWREHQKELAQRWQEAAEQRDEQTASQSGDSPFITSAQEDDTDYGVYMSYD